MSNLKDLMFDFFEDRFGDGSEKLNKETMLKVLLISGSVMAGLWALAAGRRFATHKVAELLSVTNEMLFLSISLKRSELLGEVVPVLPKFDEARQAEFMEKCNTVSKITKVLPEGYFDTHDLVPTTMDELCLLIDVNLELLNYFYSTLVIEQKETNSVEAVMEAIRVVRNNVTLPLINEETREHYVSAYNDLSKLLLEFRHELKGYSNVIRTGAADVESTSDSPQFSSIFKFVSGVFK